MSLGFWVRSILRFSHPVSKYQHQHHSNCWNALLKTSKWDLTEKISLLVHEVSSRAFLSLEMGYSHMQYLFSVQCRFYEEYSSKSTTENSINCHYPITCQNPSEAMTNTVQFTPCQFSNCKEREKIWFKLFPEYLIIFCSTLVTLSGVTGGPFNDKAHSLRTAEGIMTGPAAQLFDYKYILWCTSWFEKCVGHFVLLCGCKWQLH